MELGTQRNCAGNGCSMEELQKKLAIGDWMALRNDDSIRMYHELLAQRLERIQNMGGPFSSVDFSPEIKALFSVSPGKEHTPLNKSRALV
ncbi:MAG: hypothetical protein JW860_06480 [Sedimentisphaerales bacterium]|nr:hypothetical protein [Sedimentisphaerales bacterium]